LIENETTPLSDAALARMLTERGYAIARRTVAKYREQMNILPSKLR
jgi:RNA polymerase sigma-54 factor